MRHIIFSNNRYNCREDETLLDALLRQGGEIPFSCRSGVCHACLMRASSGEPGTDSQTGISTRLQDKKYFLPCKCHPETDLSIQKPINADLKCLAIVHAKEQLSDDVWVFQLEPSVEIFYHAGQFINISNQQSIVRSYSLASVPHQDYFLELHVKRHPQGIMSQWLIDEVAAGDEIELTRPQGENYYRANSVCNLLLASSGTGLAPVIGVARDALYSGHTGEIHLYHAAKDTNGLYQHEKLINLSDEFPQFHYHPCPLTNKNIQQAIGSDHSNLSDWVIHVAGNPQLISEIEILVQQLGARSDQIYIDPFLLRSIVEKPDSGSESEQHNRHKEEVAYPSPSLELWQALGEGTRLKKILDDFYDAVFNDPILSPYFHNSTKQRAKEKVYSFYRRLFSGDPVFFGDRPRNAHHWMVISDEIFNYRETLLKSFMIKHELPEDKIEKWQALEELYRPDIVKDGARGRVVGSSESPVEGYDTIELTVGGMCDACEDEIDSGTVVNYHLRTGHVYCEKCFENQ